MYVVVRGDHYLGMYHHETCPMLKMAKDTTEIAETIEPGGRLCRRCDGELVVPQKRLRRSAAKPTGRFTVENGVLVPLACPVCLSQQHLDRKPGTRMWTCRCGWEGEVDRNKWRWNGTGKMKKRT